MHAAEDNEVRLRVTRDLFGELVGIAGVVRELDDLVALIVVTEDDEAAAKRCPGRGNPQVHLLVGERDVALRQRLPLGEAAFLVLGQYREHRASTDRPLNGS